MKKLKLLVLFYSSVTNATLSYQSSWSKNLVESKLFLSKELNLAQAQVELAYKRITRWRHFNAIVLLHSVFSNTNYLSKPMMELLANSKVPIIYFIGNEYKLMHKKMEMCDNIGINMLVTQSNSSKVKELYRKRLRCEVNYLPNTGLDTSLFNETTPFAERAIDIGYRSFQSPWYLGHDERTIIVEYFDHNAGRHGVTTDMSLDPSKRMASMEWAAFLNRCKAQIGTEAGGDFFELDDRTRLAVNDYICSDKTVSFDQVYSKFFEGYTNNIPLRIMSSRNIEAAGTKTLQILFEGEYNGHFKAGEHYIALKKDFSNFDDVMAQFNNHVYCKEIVENAYKLVVEEFRYEKLLLNFHKMVKGIL